MLTSSATSPLMREQARRIADARRAAAAELLAVDNVERPITDPAVIKLASARLYAEAVMLKVLSGDVPPASEIKAAQDMVTEARAAVPKPVAVQVTYVHPTTKCPKCQHEFSLDLPDDDNGSPVQAANAKPLLDDPYVVAQPADSSAPSSPPSCTDLVPGAGKISTGRTPTPNVVELKRPSIHDPVVFGDGTKLNPPLKRLGPREAWQGYPLPTV
jgi:hypothetical protein